MAQTQVNSSKIASTHKDLIMLENSILEILQQANNGTMGGNYPSLAHKTHKLCQELSSIIIKSQASIAYKQNED